MSLNIYRLSVIVPALLVRHLWHNKRSSHNRRIHLWGSSNMANCWQLVWYPLHSEHCTACCHPAQRGLDCCNTRKRCCLQHRVWYSTACRLRRVLWLLPRKSCERLRQLNLCERPYFLSVCCDVFGTWRQQWWRWQRWTEIHQRQSQTQQSARTRLIARSVLRTSSRNERCQLVSTTRYRRHHHLYLRIQQTGNRKQATTIKRSKRLKTNSSRNINSTLQNIQKTT